MDGVKYKSRLGAGPEWDLFSALVQFYALDQPTLYHDPFCIQISSRIPLKVLVLFKVNRYHEPVLKMWKLSNNFIETAYCSLKIFL